MPGRGAEQVEDPAAPGHAGVQRVDRDQRRAAPGTTAASSPGTRARPARRRARASGPPPAADVPRGLDRAQGGVRRGDEQQDEHRVGVVEAEHQHRDRGQRHHRAGEQTGARRARRTTDRGVEQRHGRHALERLRHQDAPRREPEDPDRQPHRPQRQRRLVDGDRAGGVGGAEEERLPRLRAGLRGRGVERVGPARRPQPPEVEDRGREEQAGERQPLGRHGEPRERGARRLSCPGPPTATRRAGDGRVTGGSPVRASRDRAGEVVSDVMPRLSLPGLATPPRPPVPPL